MKNIPRCLTLVLLVAFFCLAQAGPAWGQQVNAQPAKAPTCAVAEQAISSQGVSSGIQVVPALPVPRLIKFGGVAREASGQPHSGVVGITFAIYAEQEGGATLWMETHNAELDPQGRYSVLLGSTQSQGMPLDLFATGDPRWLGVQVQLPGEVEQPRVLLVSVPYALKAADAESLGGKPASAYALAPATTDAGASGGTATGTGTKPTKSTNNAVANATTAGFIPVFTDNTGTLGNSVMIQSGSNIGIGQNPVQTLDVNGGVRGSGLATGSRGTAQDAINTAALFLGGSNAMGLIGTNTAGFAAGGLFTTASFFAGAKERMTINGTTGNVGIGTFTPGGSLTVAGNIQITGNGNALTFPDNSSLTSAGNINGNLSVTGQVTVLVPGAGLLFKSGTNCVLLTISNTGTLQQTPSSC